MNLNLENFSESSVVLPFGLLVKYNCYNLEKNILIFKIKQEKKSHSKISLKLNLDFDNNAISEDEKALKSAGSSRNKICKFFFNVSRIYK